MEDEQEHEQRGRGRPRKIIDLAELETLARTWCTNEEIAAHFGVSERTIDSRLASNKRFREARERGKAKGRLSLRRAQLKKALQGNPTMQIWLGKQELGQRDKVELSGKDGAPVVQVVIRSVLDGLPVDPSTKARKED